MGYTSWIPALERERHVDLSFRPAKIENPSLERKEGRKKTKRGREGGREEEEKEKETKITLSQMKLCADW